MASKSVNTPEGIERDVVLLDTFSAFQDSAKLLWSTRGKSFSDVCEVIECRGDSVLTRIEGYEYEIKWPMGLLPLTSEIVADFNEGVGGVEGAKRPEDFAIPENYLLELFALDENRPAFALDAIAHFYDVSRLANDEGMING